MKRCIDIKIVEGQMQYRQKEENDIQSQKEKMTNICLYLYPEDIDSQSPQEQVHMKKPLKCDPREISKLNQQQRQKIRKQHPQMRQYYFLAARQKAKYFHHINQKYRKDIKLGQNENAMTMKKTIGFKKKFQIRSFRSDQQCQQIKNKKSLMELYKANPDNKQKLIHKI